MLPPSPSSSNSSRTILQGSEDDNLWSQNYSVHAQVPASSLPSGGPPPPLKQGSLSSLWRSKRRGTRRPKKYKVWHIALTIIVLVLIAGGGVYAALPVPSLTTPGAARSQRSLQTGITPAQTHSSSGASITPAPHSTPTASNTITPTKPTATPAPNQGVAVPSAWSQSGLSQADALETVTAANEFDRREMLLDYRNVGTRRVHAGTLTAAFPLLTPAAQQRFCQNDKRVTTVFFDQIQQEQLIQLPINLQAHIDQVQQHLGKTFAWVTVAFQLVFQHGATGPLSAPVNHSLNILLVREPLADPVKAQVGGGLGWLVSNYVLDSSTPAALLPNP